MLPKIATACTFAFVFSRVLGVAAKKNHEAWHVKDFKSLVIFGDSYSDDSRAGYFDSHNGTAPPVGFANPVNYHASDGGRIWGEYVQQYSGANLYNYAVSGGVCSNDITPRIWTSIMQDFPSIKEYEVPAFLADSNYTDQAGKDFLNIPPKETVYAIWTGTNDLDHYSILTDAQVPGTNITTYIDCVYDQLETLYQNGARNFVLMNVVPLQLAPLYALPSMGGVPNSEYWPDKSGNLTEISYRMMEQVVTTNMVYKYRTPFEAMLSGRFHGAQFALMDMYGLFMDIYNNPANYLNGTHPLSVTDFVAKCDLNFSNCEVSDNPDAFMWYDTLHPSEQTQRVIASTFVDVVKGTSDWASYWRG